METLELSRLRTLPLSVCKTVFRMKSVNMTLKRKVCSCGTDVYDFQPPADPGEETGMRLKKKRTQSFKKLISLKVLHWNSSSDETQHFSQERKKSSHISHVYDSHPRTPPKFSTCVAENPQSHGVSEENEMPLRKRRKTKKLASFNVRLSKISSSLEESGEPADRQVQTPPASVHNSLTEEDILSRYEIGLQLGQGGYGCVFEGNRLEDGLEVAIKIVRKPKNMRYINIPGHPEPLPLEVGLLIQVNTGTKVQQIIELLDWQDQQDRYIMVLERPSPCKDLFEFEQSLCCPINESWARYIMAQTTLASLTCYRRGVFHRDIKLENLLINTETLMVKLIDFGCGDLWKTSGYDRFLGSRKYIPPEYFKNRKYHGGPSTAWSLGVLLFRLMCKYFPEATDIKTINNGTWTEPGLSNECCHLLRALLQENPSQRINLGEILKHEWFMMKMPQLPQRILKIHSCFRGS